MTPEPEPPPFTGAGAWLSAPAESERGGTGHKIVISGIMLIDGLIADKDKRLSIQHLPLSENSEGQRVLHFYCGSYHPHLRVMML